jgi:hypothetical protein
MSKPISVLNSNHAASVAIARSDVKAFIESDIPLPIMFRSKEALVACMQVAGMKEQKLNRISKNNALLFVGNYFENPALPLEALWVRANWKKYRVAFLAKHKRSKIPAPPSDLNADHIVNQKSLEEFGEKFEPWVMIFEVPSNANSGFGSSIESHLPRIQITQTQVFLSPLHVFKLFSTDMPRTKSELNDVMRAISGQILDQNYVSKIRLEVESACDFK